MRESQVDRADLPAIGGQMTGRHGGEGVLEQPRGPGGEQLAAVASLHDEGRPGHLDQGYGGTEIGPGPPVGGPVGVVEGRYHGRGPVRPLRGGQRGEVRTAGQQRH